MPTPAYILALQSRMRQEKSLLAPLEEALHAIDCTARIAGKYWVLPHGALFNPLTFMVQRDGQTMDSCMKITGTPEQMARTLKAFDQQKQGRLY